MKVYSVEIRYIDFSPRTFKVLAADMKEANERADMLLTTCKEYLSEDAELICVELDDEVTDPMEFYEESKADHERALKEAKEETQEVQEG